MQRLTDDTRTIPTVFVVEDDVLIRESLEALIRFGGWQARCFGTAEEFLQYPRLRDPACVVMDLCPELIGLDLQELITDRAESPVIFIAGHCDVSLAVRAMRAGAVEFMTKPFDPEAMLAAIGEALERSCHALACDAEQRRLKHRFSLLSVRERDVLELVVQGLLNKQVAAALGISEYTVKSHRGEMMRKLKTRSVADLVRMFEALRLAESPMRPHARRQPAFISGGPVDHANAMMVAMTR